MRVPIGGKLQKMIILWMALFFIFLSLHMDILFMNFFYLLGIQPMYHGFLRIFLFFFLFKGIFCLFLPLCHSLPLNDFHSFEYFSLDS